MKKYLDGDNTLHMTRRQVRCVDSRAINTLGVAGVVLMENAGRSCAEFIQRRLADRKSPAVCILCGTGNNGGDGYVIARHLLNAGLDVKIGIAGAREKVKGDAAINLEILERMNQRVHQIDMDQQRLTESVKELADGCDMIVDCLFGTGLSGEIRGSYHRLIQIINSLDKTVLAVDIPSGLDCDTGLPLGIAVKADYTITFVAVKEGFRHGHARQYTGQIYVASIGVPPVIVYTAYD